MQFDDKKQLNIAASNHFRTSATPAAGHKPATALRVTAVALCDSSCTQLMCILSGHAVHAFSALPGFCH